MVFEYRFDRLMKLSETEKNDLERQYNQMYNLLEEQGKKLIELMERKETLQNQLSQKQQEKVTIITVVEQSRALDRIGQLIRDEQMKYEQLRNRLEAFRATLVEKSIELKKYQKLKEIHLVDYMDKEKLAENKQMDETASQNFLRQ